MSKKKTKSVTTMPSEMNFKYPEDFVNKFICGNTVDVMQQMPNSCVDVVVTSPPYNLKNSTGNGMKERNPSQRR